MLLEAVCACVWMLLRNSLSDGACDVVACDWRGHYQKMSGFLYTTAAFIPGASSVGIHATGDELNCAWLVYEEKNLQSVQS